MRGFSAFVKKEWLEYIRNFKWFILLAAFFLIGVSSPLLAKMMPDILSNIDMNGMEITLPEPTEIDAYGQFFKNMTQMGMVVLLLVFGGILSQELAKGTLTILLAKGLSRQSVILAKFSVALAIWTVTFVVAAATNHGYTVYFFGETDFNHLFFSLFCLWLFGAFVIALLLFFGTLTTGYYGGLLLTVGLLGVLIFVNSFTDAKGYNPVSLASDNLPLLTGDVMRGDLVSTVSLTVGLIVLLLAGSLFLFGRKKL